MSSLSPLAYASFFPSGDHSGRSAFLFRSIGMVIEPSKVAITRSLSLPLVRSTICVPSGEKWNAETLS